MICKMHKVDALIIKDRLQGMVHCLYKRAAQHTLFKRVYKN